jgi:undecaprenyl-diphosphatase
MKAAPGDGRRSRSAWQFTQVALDVVVAGCLILSVFALVSDAILDRAPVREADAQTAAWFHQHVSPPVHDLFTVVTAFGSPVLWGLGFGLGFYFIVRRQWTLLAGWTLAMAAGKLWNEALKAWLARPRPAFPGWDNPASGYGFPSGHTMQAVIAYGMLVYLGWRRVRLRGALLAGAVLLIALIALSRLVLVVHFPSDVIGGLLAGALWLLTSIVFTEALRARAMARRSLARHQAEGEAL